MVVRKKTLGEQLSELANTVPKDFDPEDFDQDNRNNNDDEQASDNDDTAAATDHYVKVGRSLLRQGAGIDDPKYRGKKATRKDLYQEQGEDDSEEEEEEEEEEDLEEEGSMSEEEEGDSEEESEEGDLENDEVDQESEEGDLESEERDLESNEEGDEEDEEEEEDGDESSDFDDDAYGKFGADEDDDVAEVALKEELRQIEEDEKNLVQSMSRSAQSDVEKGRDVRTQLSMWDSLLDARIRLQKLVTVANRLPKHDVFPMFFSEEAGLSAENTEEVQNAKKELERLLNNLLECRVNLIACNQEVGISEDTISALRKRKRSTDEEGEEGEEGEEEEDFAERMWNDMERLSTAFVPYRNATLEKWSAKVQVTTSGPAKKLKALDQSAVTQIANALNDRERLLARTRLLRNDARILGAIETTEDKESSDLVSPDAHLKKTDAEVFDDTDFYQQLLRELIDSRMVASDDPIAQGVRWASLQSQLGNVEKKHRPGVDVRASKGRKIRYHVLEKLVGFMAPIDFEQGAWHEERVDELYASLLGKRPTAEDAESLMADGKERSDEGEDVKVDKSYNLFSLKT